MTSNGHIIAIANQKGGVGKTTLAVHLAAWLGRRRRVVLVDADPQGNASSWLLGRPPARSGLYDLLIARQPLLSVVRSTDEIWPFDLIAGNTETGDAMTGLAIWRRPFDTVAQALRPLAAPAEYVLVDMPPSKSAGFQELLYAADWVLIPTTLERLSLEGVVLMGHACRQLTEAYGRGPRLLGIVPNMARLHTLEHQAQLAQLAAVFADALWPAIPQSVRVAEASSRGQSLFEFAPKEPVTAAVEEICFRVRLNIGASDGQDA